MRPINENYRYSLTDEVAIEDFDDGSLIFLCKKLQFIHINKTAKKILELMDGHRNIKQIVRKISETYSLNLEVIEKDILGIVKELNSNGVLKPVVKLKIQRSKNMSKKSSFMANPDVSLREENSEGALLYNADTESLLIINKVGLIIWNFVKINPRTKEDVINHIKERCENIPIEQLETDMNSFLNELYNKGFIGEVVNE
ncbi:MAG: PqqD family peptide modification chaperone [Candidatus Aminicenantes bacterium]|nr:PqqD family peptide modification chaperone [Candidatus Aminicenantes bacterium]